MRATALLRHVKENTMFKRKKTPKGAELERIRKKFDADTQGMSMEQAMKSMGLNAFLMLLNIADNDAMGKSKAILYAYRLGALSGKRNLAQDEK